jgi:signal transduction histidine kinase
MSREDPALAVARDRVRLALPAASALRDQAERVSLQAGHGTRPRRRFLAARRLRLSNRLMPTLAVIGGMSAAMALLDVLGLGVATVDTTEVVTRVLMSLLLAIAVARLPQSFRTLVLVTAVASTISLAGWAFTVHETGGATSPYALVIPTILVVVLANLPVPPPVAAGIAAWGYASFLFGMRGAPVSVHLLALSVALGGVLIVRQRHKVSLRAFLKNERLARAVARMRHVQEQLIVVEKLEALRVLVGGMAHELNNALAISVASNQQAAREAETKAPAAALAIKRSDGGLQRIRRTVDRLRRFAMAAEGTLEPADVGAMLDFALESAIGRARSGVIIERVYDPSVGAIECHVAALAEALFQIARNAVEAMPGGGTIQAKVRNEGDRVVLAVSDEGRGIPPEELARVFDPFYSRNQGQKSAQKSGLGLSAVYGLVSALGGTVEIRSAVNQGTEVAIVMPKKQAREGA